MGKRKIPLNNITLRFKSDKLETHYKKISAGASLRLVRISIILGLILVPAFGILDIWMVSERLWTIWGIRMALVIFLLLMYFFSFQSIFRKNLQIFLSLMTAVLGAGIISMVLISESHGGYFYYAGLMLVIQFAHGLIRLRFVFATIATALITLTYLLIAWGIKNTPGELIINNSFFLFSTLIIGMVINYSLEYYIRSNFWQRIILTRQKKLLRSEHQRKTLELLKVQKLQLALLPKEIPLHPSIELAVSTKNAVEVGGDYYDFNVNEGKKLSFAIGDATGHGAEAGALVTATKILFSCWGEDEDILKFINNASSAIKKLGMPHLFMALVAGRIMDNNLELAGGGLPPALIYRKESRTIEGISLKGFPLGCVLNHSYKKISINLKNGDILLFMTDGFPELFNSKKEMYGLEKIKKSFSDVVNEHPSHIVDHLNGEVDNWRNNFPLQDDITFLVFKAKDNLIIK